MCRSGKKTDVLEQYDFIKKALEPEDDDKEDGMKGMSKD